MVTKTTSRRRTGPQLVWVGLLTFLLTAAAVVHPVLAQQSGPFNLRVGVSALPRTYDPLGEPGGLALPILRLMFEGLVAPDSQGRPQPVLAESWRLVNDTTWEFTLRRGVRFHNGEEFNAEVVKWNIEFNKKPENSVFAARIEPVTEAEVVDEYTVRIHTREPTAGLLGNLMSLLMLPPRYYEEVGGRAGFTLNPVGTGPYRYVNQAPDSFIQLTRNEEYWGQTPPVDNLTFRLIPEDATRVGALMTGEIDVAYLVPPEHLPALNSAGFQIKARPLGQGLIFVMTQPTTTIEPLKDKRVRQAINYAVDKEAIVEALVGGLTEVLQGQLIGPDGFGFNPNVTAYPYNPQKARELLKEAGYENGFSLTISGTAARYPQDQAISEAVAEYLRLVGIDVRLNLLEAGTWTDRYLNQTLDPMWIIGLNYLPSMDWVYAGTHFSYQSPRRFWHDEKFDELFLAQNTEMDPVKREAILHEIAAHMREEAPALFLHQLPLIVGISPAIEGLEFNADYTMELMNARRR